MNLGDRNMTTEGLRHLGLVSEYNTEDDDIIRDLYGPCLAVSIKYDRAVGYFRANIYRELGEELLDFVIKGGKVRIVCSPDIPVSDEEAAREGYALRGTRSSREQEATLVHVIKAMSEDPEEKDCLDMLRLLIERGSLDLYVATRPGGIYHRKIGMFVDSSSDTVVFSGSGNETQKAISSIEDWSNDEDFDVFRSWGDEFESTKARKKAQYLTDLFETGTRRTRVRPLNEVEREIINRFRSHSELEDCRPGAHTRSTSRIEEAPLGPFFYQQKAIEAWEKAGRVGMLSMATGTGKTLTALFAVKDLVAKGDPILVVVPSKILLDQWRRNIRGVFPDVPILLAGGGFDWKSDPTKRMYVSSHGLSRIVLATMQTAATKEFLDFFAQAEGAVLIADEAHRLGSAKHRTILSLKFRGMLGLSATPERLFDKEGSEALASAFGKNPIFDLPIEAKVQLEANDQKEVPILGHFLSRYYYDFDVVNLSPDEEQEWQTYSSEIGRTIAKHPDLAKDGLGAGLESSRLKMLFIQRARIVKGARSKVEAASRIIATKYPSNGRWIVYCDDEVQLRSVVDELKRSNPNLVVLEYHSRMNALERARSLAYFENNPSVIVSIRCLDEGVDIPTADGAIILASSTNPREYIQRRGRLLRKAKGKTYAKIIDVIVLPSSSSDENDIPFSIIRSELARAYTFAGHAENKEITHKLWQVCRQYAVRLDSDPYYALEEDEAEE